MSANRDDEYSKFIPQKFHYEIIPALDNKDHYQKKPLVAEQQHEHHHSQQQQQQQLQPATKQQVLIIDKQQQQQLQLNYQRQQQLQKQQQLSKSNDTSQKDQSTVRRGILHQIIATCAVLLLSSACGMPIGYSAVLLPQLVGANGTNAEILIDIEMGSWIASVHSLATPFGSLLSGPLADFIGRRTALMIAIIPLLLGWGALALAKSFTMLIIGRLLCGCGVGILGGPAQVYIAETAEPNLRGLLIGAPFVSYSLGILIVYALGSSLHWRAVAWCSVILPLCAALALLCIPESPAWLLRNKKQKKALKALTFLRGNNLVAQKELNDMQERLQRELATTKTNENIFQLCCQRVAIKPLFIVITFCFFQMFTGTFIVVFYAIDIISEFGADFDTKTAAIWTAVVRILCTFIFCFVLLFIKRRPIILMASLVSGLSCLVLSIYMYVYANSPKSFTDVIVAGVCLLTYIAFNTALMIMPGIMIGELFPAKIRGRTAGGVFAAMNVALFGFTKAFPYLQAQLKMRGVFMIFAISGFLVSIFMFMFQPETKGRSLDQIEDYFNEDNWLWLRRDRSSKFEQQDKLMQQEQQCEKAECNS